MLDVWVELPAGEIARAGTLACSKPAPSGAFESEFEYLPEWLHHPQAFPLDPVSLPLRAGGFVATSLYPPLAVFDDALPDDWGRAVMIRSVPLTREHQGEPYLLRELARRGTGLGALLLAVPGSGKPARSGTGEIGFARMARAAGRFDAGLATTREELELLARVAGSAGGARPKVLYHAHGHPWIAKFASSRRDGRHDIVGLEAASLTLAKRAGLEVPRHRLEPLERGGRALLVERFDIAPGGGRHHMISLRTLCKERPGLHVLAYGELADAVRKVSATPQRDIDALFSQMAFNAALGNTDDHLKNFWMVRDASGYRLSPAFDLLPDVGERREHVLQFLYERTAPSRETLLTIAQRWGVTDAQEAIARIVRALRAFAAVARKAGVPSANVDELQKDIAARCARLAVVSAPRRTKRPS